MSTRYWTPPSKHPLLGGYVFSNCFHEFSRWGQKSLHSNFGGLNIRRKEVNTFLGHPLGTISIWSHQHFDHFVTTTHPSHHVITKLVIPYHLPTCHKLSSLGKKKKKEETNKESAVALVFFWRKQKRKTG